MDRSGSGSDASLPGVTVAQPPAAVPARARASVANLVVAVASIGLVAGACFALAPPRAASDLETFIPVDGTFANLASLNRESAEQRFYANEQGVRPGPAAAADLPASVLQATGLSVQSPLAKHRWLQVSLNSATGDQRTQTLSFALAGSEIEWVSNSYAGGFQVPVPALPLLNRALLAGGSIDYVGRMNSATRQDEPLRATIAARPSTFVPGCTDSVAELAVGEPVRRVRQITVWCPETKPMARGFAGLVTGTDAQPIGAVWTGKPPPAVRSDLTARPAPQPPTVGKSEPIDFYEASGDFEPMVMSGALLDATNHQTLVVARNNESDVLDFDVLPGAPGVGYGLRWRARPGGEVSAMIVVGDVVAVATSQRHLVAYDRYGRRLWTVPTAELVSGLTRSRDRLVAVAADGTVSAVSVADGTTVWSRRVGARLTTAVADASSGLVVATDSGLVSLDPDDGSTRWEAGISSTVVAATASTVFDGQASLLTGRSGPFGRPRWQTSVPGRSEALLPVVSGVVVSTTLGTAGVDDTGQTRWRASRALRVAVQGDEIFLAHPDHLDLRRGVAGVVQGTWAMPALVTAVNQPVLTDRGVIGSVLTADRGTRYWRWS